MDRKREEGWSLPLIPILLVMIAVSVYFFGWWALLVPAAAALLITLGTAIHDRLKAGREPDTMHFWFHSDQDLRELWTLVGGTETFSHDAENVWEWIGSQLHEGSREYHVSISRKHSDLEYPVHIRVTCFESASTPGMRDDLGRRFADALKTDVKTGSVEYIGGNDHVFTEEATFGCGAGA